MIDRDIRYNGSGYPDPTAYQAIKHIQAEEKETERLHKLLNLIFMICELSDFIVVERITLRDKRTGKIYR